MTTVHSGWSRTKELRSQAANRRPYKPPDVVGDGPEHAVREGDQQALCGARIVLTGNPWPTGIGGARCRDCMRNATPNPTPL